MTQGNVYDASVPNAYREFHAKATTLLAGLTPENKNDPAVGATVDELIFRSRLAQKAIDDVKDLVRQAVERVGPIPLANGLALGLRPQEVRSLDPVKAFKVARQHLPDTDILDAMKISLPKLLAAKAAQHGRGEKKNARIQLEEELKAAGAVTVTVRHIMEEMDLDTPKKELGNDGHAETVRDGAGTHDAGRGAAQLD